MEIILDIGCFLFFCVVDDERGQLTDRKLQEGSTRKWRAGSEKQKQDLGDLAITNISCVCELAGQIGVGCRCIGP